MDSVDLGGGEPVNFIEVDGSEQVMLRVRVVEIQRQVTKNLGVDTQFAITSGSQLLRAAAAPAGTASAAFSALGGGNPLPINSGGTLHLTDTFGKAQFGAVVRALERAEIIRTLAEPTLIALSGENASFLAGGEIPFFSTPDAGGRTAVEYRSFGVQLEFTPTVLSEGRINLEISTEVSEPAGTGAAPRINVRNAETVVELPDGGSLVIAGLIRNNTTQTVEGVPGAKDVPVIGQLFRSQEFRSDESELAVFVTPILVSPTSEGDLIEPGYDYTPVSDPQAILFGKLNRVYGPPGAERPEGIWHGEAGFILEE